MSSSISPETKKRIHAALTTWNAQLRNEFRQQVDNTSAPEFIGLIEDLSFSWLENSILDQIMINVRMLVSPAVDKFQSAFEIAQKMVSYMTGRNSVHFKSLPIRVRTEMTKINIPRTDEIDGFVDTIVALTLDFASQEHSKALLLDEITWALSGVRPSELAASEEKENTKDKKKFWIFGNSRVR